MYVYVYMAWQSLMYRIPRGLMAWGVRACTNTSATPDNLSRWGMMVSNMDGCNAPCTLGHLLSHCTMMLDRYKFRHDSVLNHILTTVIEEKAQSLEIYY